MLKTFEKLARWNLNRRGFESHNTQTSVGRIHHYNAEGSGSLPPFVMLHGLGSSASGYAPILPILRRHTQHLFAPDAPGHGWSQTPPNFELELMFTGLEELLQQHPHKPFVLFGNSLGGAMALRYAIDHPEDVRALLLCSPAGAPLQPHEFTQLQKTFNIQTRQDARTFLRRLYHRAPWYSRMLEPFIMQMLQRPHLQQIFEEDVNERAFQPDELSSLSMPLLLLWGRSEKLLPQSSLSYFREHLPPHAQIQTPEGEGHSPHVEYPRAFTQRLVSFVSSLS